MQEKIHEIIVVIELSENILIDLYTMNDIL